jgi:hypothetical protein
MEFKKSHLRKLKLSIDIDSVNIYVELGSRVDPIHIAYWVIDEWEEDASCYNQYSGLLNCFI